MKRLALALLAFLAAPALAALPMHIAAEYDLASAGLVIGHVVESFARTGDTYEIRSVSRAQGLLKTFYDERITMQSSGRVVESGLKPLQYEERRVHDPRFDVSATFDWEHGVMRSRYRGETSEHPLPADTQDRISMMYQFMHGKVEPGNRVLAMSNGRKVERYTYRFVDEVRTTTPAGEFDTLHFEKVPSDAKDRHVEVWLAKARNNFPVRVVFDDPRGLRVEQVLTSLRTEGG